MEPVILSGERCWHDECGTWSNETSTMHVIWRGDTRSTRSAWTARHLASRHVWRRRNRTRPVPFQRFILHWAAIPGQQDGTICKLPMHSDNEQEVKAVAEQWSIEASKLSATGSGKSSEGYALRMHCSVACLRKRDNNFEVHGVI
jgi:hypothetical protein